MTAATVSMFLSMLVNAMWFGVFSAPSVPGIDVFGLVTVSWEEVSMAFLVNVVTFPLVFLITFLFKYSKPSKLRSNTIKKALETKEANEKQSNDEKGDDSDDDEDDDEDDEAAKEEAADTKSLVSVGKTYFLKDFMQIFQKKICKDSTSTVSSTSTTQSLASSVTKPKFSFPFFCIYLSWLLSWSLIVLSAFFLWAYGVAYGNDFITKWFISFVLSFWLASTSSPRTSLSSSVLTSLSNFSSLSQSVPCMCPAPLSWNSTL